MSYSDTIQTRVRAKRKLMAMAEEIRMTAEFMDQDKGFWLKLKKAIDMYFEPEADSRLPDYIAEPLIAHGLHWTEDMLSHIRPTKEVLLKLVSVNSMQMDAAIRNPPKREKRCTREAIFRLLISMDADPLPPEEACEPDSLPPAFLGLLCSNQNIKGHHADAIKSFLKSRMDASNTQEGAMMGVKAIIVVGNIIGNPMFPWDADMAGIVSNLISARPDLRMHQREFLAIQNSLATSQPSTAPRKARL